MTEALDLAANVGATGVLLWLVYYVFNTLLPKMTAQFVASLESAQNQHTAQIRLLIEAQREESLKTHASLKAVETSLEQLTRLLILHDATTRGGPLGTVTAELARSAGVPPEVVEGAVLHATTHLHGSEDTEGLIRDIVHSALEDYRSRVASV